MGRGEGLGICALDGVDELGASEDTVDVTGVVTEENTTEGGEGGTADEVT